jgi:hypothetical protein
VELSLALLADMVEGTPPPELQALLDAVGQGHPLAHYLRC